MTQTIPCTREQRLKQLAAQLLDDRFPPDALSDEAAELAALLAELGGFQPLETELNRRDSWSDNGLTVSPDVAAMCARGSVRTIQYLRGLNDAIAEVRNRHPHRPARILYVGCGPYATLATPLMTLLDPTTAQFSLLDFHRDAIGAVQRLHQCLGVSDRVATLESGDATRYRIDPAAPPDIIMMEIMLPALESEPQVAITRHLLGQAPDALLIPRQVSIDLAWADPGVEFGNGSAESKRAARLLAGRAFTLDRDTALGWDSEERRMLPGFILSVPQAIEARHCPFWFTRMHLFGERRLDDYESGLTSPRAASLAGGVRPGDTIETTYRLGRHPQLIGQMPERP